jgi:heme exporter protein D
MRQRWLACTIVWTAFVLSLSAILFCSYSFLYFARVTATPLTSAQLARARYDAHVWLALVGLGVVTAIISLVLAIRLRRPKVLTDFEVLPISDGPGAE